MNNIEVKIISLKLQKQLRGKSVSEIKKLICGKKIGSGLYRTVYVLKKNPNYVVKIERDMSSAMFANVTEFRNYINNKEWKWFEKWLAPCELINETGSVLIQQRVEHRQRKFYPKQIPAMFTDTKLKNFGFIGDRFVCCDYSFLTVVMNTRKKNNMKTARWWNSEK